MKTQIRKQGFDVMQLHIDEPHEPLIGGPVQSRFDTPSRTPAAIPRRLFRESINSTPVFHQKARLSGGSAVDSPLDPFGDEEIFDVKNTRKRPRISWGSPKNRWKVVQVTPSPEKQNQNTEDDVFWLGSQQEHLFGDESDLPSNMNANETQRISGAESAQHERIELNPSSPCRQFESTSPRSTSPFVPFRDASESKTSIIEDNEPRSASQRSNIPANLPITPVKTVTNHENVNSTEEQSFRDIASLEPTNPSSQALSAAHLVMDEGQPEMNGEVPENSRPEIMEVSPGESFDSGDDEAEVEPLPRESLTEVTMTSPSSERVPEDSDPMEMIEPTGITSPIPQIEPTTFACLDPVVIPLASSRAPDKLTISPLPSIKAEDAVQTVHPPATSQSEAPKAYIIQSADLTSQSSSPQNIPASPSGDATISPSKSSFRMQPSNLLSDSMFGFGFRSQRASGGSRISEGSSDLAGPQDTAESETAAQTNLLQSAAGEEDDDLYRPRSRPRSVLRDVHDAAELSSNTQDAFQREIKASDISHQVVSSAPVEVMSWENSSGSLHASLRGRDKLALTESSVQESRPGNSSIAPQQQLPRSHLAEQPMVEADLAEEQACSSPSSAVSRATADTSLQPEPDTVAILVADSKEAAISSFSMPYTQDEDDRVRPDVHNSPTSEGNHSSQSHTDGTTNGSQHYYDRINSISSTHALEEIGNDKDDASSAVPNSSQEHNQPQAFETVQATQHIFDGSDTGSQATTRVQDSYEAQIDIEFPEAVAVQDMSSFLSISQFEEPPTVSNNAKINLEAVETIDLTSSVPLLDSLASKSSPVPTSNHSNYSDGDQQLDTVLTAPLTEPGMADTEPTGLISQAILAEHNDLDSERTSTPSHSTTIPRDTLPSGRSHQRSVSRSSSAIDVMEIFGVKRPQAPRLSQQTTAVRSDLSIMAREASEEMQSLSERITTPLAKPRQRRPGEVRKVLKIPEAPPQLFPASQQFEALTDFAKREMQSSPHRARTRSQSILCQSQVVDSVEIPASQKSSQSAAFTPTKRGRGKSRAVGSLEASSAPAIPEMAVSPFRILRSASKTVQSPTKATPRPLNSQRASTRISNSQDLVTSTAMTEEDPFTQADASTISANVAPFDGLRTRHGYYTALSQLPKHLNSTSSFDSKVDVIAVVSHATTAAVKAEKGRRDWSTKMRITQPGFYRETTLVQVFRGYKAAVPQADVGDVVLLRTFQVTSMKQGGAALKSPDGSAWCVFKANAKHPGRQLRRGRKSDDLEDEREGEEMTGPIPEFGDAERAAVEEMKAWWRDRKSRKQETRDKSTV